MPIATDQSRITSIRVIPWEDAKGEFGVAYRRDDGTEGAKRAGTRAEAEAIVREVEHQSIGVAAQLLPKDVVGS